MTAPVAHKPTVPPPVKSESDSEITAAIEALTIPPLPPDDLSGAMLDKWIVDKLAVYWSLHHYDNHFRWRIGRAMLKRRPEIKQGKWEQHVEETYDIETRTAINWMDVAEFIPYGADLDMGWAILVQKAREIKAKRGSNRKGAHKNRTPGKSSRKQKEQARQVKQEQWGSSKLGRKLQTLERLAEQTDYQIREYKTYTTADVSKVRRIVDFLQKLLTDIQSKAKPAVKANAK